jgi:hypothetical protein
MTQILLSDFLEDAPSHLGILARAIDSTLRYSRPSLSLPAAITFLAALKCGRVFDASGIEPNIYTLAIAPTGYGKSQVQKCLEDLLAELKIDLMGREPASDAGLLRSLREKPRQMLCYDEFGLTASEYATGKSGHKSLIMKYFLDLFSKAGRRLRGLSYSERQPEDIESPYLSLFASTTSSTLFPNLTEAFIHNGFFSRFFIFFAEEDLNSKRKTPKRFEIPDDTKAYLATIEQWQARKGNLGAILGKEKMLIELNNSKIFRDFATEFEETAENCKDESERVFWIRARELFTKLCLVALPDFKKPSLEILSWCEGLTSYCVRKAHKECISRIGSTNNRSQAKEAFLKLLDKDERLSRKELTRRILNRKIMLSKTEKSDILNELVESGLWEESQEINQESQKKTTFYKKL